SSTACVRVSASIEVPTRATRSPASPHFEGSATVSVSAAATAASNALPPSRSASAPTAAAALDPAATAPVRPDAMQVRACRPVMCSLLNLAGSVVAEFDHVAAGVGHVDEICGTTGTPASERTFDLLECAGGDEGDEIGLFD